MSEESAIEREILNYLNKQPHCRFYKTPNQGGKGARRKAQFKGMSDIAGCYHSLYIAIEVKTKTGKQSEDQKVFEKDIKNAQGEYWLVRSLEELIYKLNRVIL